LAVIGALLVASTTFAAEETFKIQGFITARNGERMTVTSADGTENVITLTDSTDIKAVTGALGAGRGTRADTDLIPGLPVTVDATHNGQEIDAVAVRFRSGDLKTSQQMKAANAENDRNIAENAAKAAHNAARATELERRLSEANEYVQKAEVTVLFAVNSAVISAEGKQNLKALAAQALTIKGYLVSVVGYTDTTGNPEANQKLSDRRATAVVNYLQKSTGLKPYRVLAADPMGQEHQIGESHTEQGKAANRRVVVKILVNKGLEGL
jgi:outer membrane protein OmpA-like peptidoglycan-associated protein